MSANAGTWFYSEPENQNYLISERLNGTFWQARIYELYWTCVQAEAPYKAEAYLADGKGTVTLEWVPGKWLALSVPEGYDADLMVSFITERVLMIPVSVTYSDDKDNEVYEWHNGEVEERWRELQGVGRYSRVQRL